MINLIEKLKNPFEGLKNESEINAKCLEIAKELFEHCCIRCNDTDYYFAEIEFYYWQKDQWQEEWNKVTYPRDGYSAGQLFYHTSGVDICFESSYSEAKFGGILIRSVMDNEGNVISGPWNTMLSLLNACKDGKMPKLEEAKPRKHTVHLKSTYRALGEQDMESEKSNPLSLCYYDALPADSWNFVKRSYNKAKGEPYNTKSYYKKDRFSL